MVWSLPTFRGDGPVRVRLTDGDSTIADRVVGPLAPQGSPPKKWLYKASRVPGLVQVQLKKVALQTGRYQLSVKAKHWFTAAEANQPAGSTTLTVSVGTTCLSHVATRKVD